MKMILFQHDLQLPAQNFYLGTQWLVTQ